MQQPIKYTFSGHDSFQCRLLWLKKGYQFIQREVELRAAAEAIKKQVLASTQDGELSKIVLAMALNELMSDGETVTP